MALNSWKLAQTTHLSSFLKATSLKRIVLQHWREKPSASVQCFCSRLRFSTLLKQSGSAKLGDQHGDSKVRQDPRGHKPLQHNPSRETGDGSEWDRNGPGFWRKGWLREFNPGYLTHEEGRSWLSPCSQHGSIKPSPPASILVIIYVTVFRLLSLFALLRLPLFSTAPEYVDEAASNTPLTRSMVHCHRNLAAENLANSLGA